VEGDLVYFSSVYLDILLTIDEPAWVHTILKASSSGRHHLAAVNTNANSDAWGSPSNNSRGFRMEELLFKHGLCILNEGKKPTFENGRAATCIDITISTPALSTLISDW
jgi:hypothetical protein